MGVFMAWNSLAQERSARTFLSLAVVLTLALGGGQVRLAAAAAKDAKQEAKARFAAGQSHYNLNEFNDALREFKEAYRLHPDPVFLYNLGQCERQLGHHEEAIRFYRTFLREEPKAPNRQEVLNKIAELEETIKNKPTEPPPPVAPLGEAKPVTPPTEAQSPVAPVPPPSPTTEPANGAVSPTPVLPETPPVTPETTSPQIDLSASSEPQPEAEPTPIYRRWWFWTAAAAVVVVGAGIGIYAATAGGEASVPSSDLGSQKVF
jgi:tetratricopeptide (TPR) repeat protein